MNDTQNDPIARLLAEKDKIIRLSGIFDSTRQALADGDIHLNAAREKLEQDLFDDALSYADLAVAYYGKTVSGSQDINGESSSSPEVERLIKDAFVLLKQGQSRLEQAKQIQFAASDLKELKSNVNNEMGFENWSLVEQYSSNALISYPKSAYLKQCLELAKQKIAQTQPPKKSRFGLFSRR